ncbi:hypothetical protein EO244_13005 [Ancylomarina salipaludis]|uniref:Uncharacterized protein n=1 Tax=Ancylomarina salipaludis TaxID=2501299 RepID=A0A4Q1JJE2_9BACT|nr:hypothetical protein [Ancylomarina salipaludis]RXQ91016.1 hypothetical protein EO244_13005 [Ancylomarina salipaludis]
MRKRLTEKEIKDLKYQCRMGYVIPAMILIIGSASSMLFLLKDINAGFVFNENKLLIIVSVIALFSFLVGYGMNWKYYRDIRNKEKVIEIKRIQKIESRIDHEAGSGNMTTLPHFNEMKEFMRYDFIVENTRYRISSELFETCTEGEDVMFLYAPVSRYLLGIEKK